MGAPSLPWAAPSSAALLAPGKSFFPLSLPHLQSWGDDDTALFHTALGDLQMSSDNIINEPVNLIIQCCGSTIAHSTFYIVLR